MAGTIDRDELRDWVINRIEKDAPGARGETAGAQTVYLGRINSLVMLGTDFDLWDHKTMERIGNWVEKPRGRSLRDLLGG